MRAVNDGSSADPRLRVDLHLGTLWDLPAWSEAPTGHPREIYAAVREAGFEGVQGGDPILSVELGLAPTTFGAHRVPGGLADQAVHWRDLGFQCATLHVGSGLEDDREALVLLEEVLEVSERVGLPLYVETHRATVTQDLWRTVGFVERLPELRFNGDFSHWYTGLEMTYGDLDAKLDFIGPVLERTCFLHGRIGDSGCIQVDLDHLRSPATLEHFERIWTAAFRGFLAGAGPGDVVVFAPELLPSSIGYAQLVRDASGDVREQGDRWEQSLRLAAIARSCFEAAASGGGRAGKP
jgi:hypothetical protein